MPEGRGGEKENGAERVTTAGTVTIRREGAPEVCISAWCGSSNAVAVVA